jgi:translation elongation factor EF-4
LTPRCVLHPWFIPFPLTPLQGHVDFSWEVSRSLAACQGALLLVDATQGVQAQTLSVFHIARERGLCIIPVLNKVDLPSAQPDLVADQMQATFGLDPAEMLRISAKTGLGVESVLRAIVERVPPPTGGAQDPLKAMLFDSSYAAGLALVLDYSLTLVPQGTTGIEV